VLVGRRTPDRWFIEAAVPADNVSPGDRNRTYQIDPDVVVATLLDARRDGRHVLGFYHSHPAGRPVPSPRDLDQAWHDRVYLIVVSTGQGPSAMRCWRLPLGADTFVEDRLDVNPTAG
jgi:proteasome lid subunit RPN8/RPN11